MANQRNLAIDRYRGLAVIIMVLGNSLADVEAAPGWLKHTPDIGLTFADVVTCAFIFAIAATYRASFLRHAEKGGAYARFAGRYLAMIGVGAIFSAGGAAVGMATPWGVLQAIGVAGLMTLAVIKLPPLARAGAGLGVLAAFQLLSNFVPSFGGAVFADEHGGFYGAISWGAMLILSTVMTDYYNRGRGPFLLGLGALSVLAAGAAALVPISKNRLSASYALIAVALCAAAYLATDAVSKKLPWKSGPVIWWGENPLLLYILHLMLVGLSRAPFGLLGIEHRTLWQGLVTVSALLAVMSLAAWALHRKGKRISL